jgi:hypothetical protein
MEFVYCDGGRAEAGYSGITRDCVTRAIAIATEVPYKEVYRALNQLASSERPNQGTVRSRSDRGVHRKTYGRYLESIGWAWIPTMFVGQGCRVHMNEEELPDGRIITRLSKHLSAVIDGVIYDLEDTSRNGNRCVYGYFERKS